VRSTMTDKTIPLRTLRNEISAVLREVETEGATFTITVRGKPVARLTPAIEEGLPRTFVDTETVRRMFADVPHDPTWLPELLADREWFAEAADEPDHWEKSGK
jgi:prevent-host-death family protein